MKTTVVTINPHRPNLDQIKHIAGQLEKGKIVAFPTETVYGLAACASNKEALDRLQILKGRAQDKPFSYHIGSYDALERLNMIQSRVFRFLADRFLLWAGFSPRFPLHRNARLLAGVCDGCVSIHPGAD